MHTQLTHIAHPSRTHPQLSEKEKILEENSTRTAAKKWPTKGTEPKTAYNERAKSLAIIAQSFQFFVILPIRHVSFQSLSGNI